MLKKHSVVMLPTNKKARLQLTKNYLNLTIDEFIPDNRFTIGQHLYFLSDEEIKEGDWYVFDVGYVIGVDNSIRDYKTDNCKKIIATTNKSLANTIKSSYIQFGYKVEETKIVFLPQPSQSFIKKFVEEYNKGNIITEVMVEYDEGKYNLDELRERHLKGLPHSYDYCNLKINSDNTINIKPIKDSWSKEEIRSLKNKLISLSKEEQMRILNTVESFDKWIEENL